MFRYATKIDNVKCDIFYTLMHHRYLSSGVCLREFNILDFICEDVDNKVSLLRQPLNNDECNALNIALDELSNIL